MYKNNEFISPPLKTVNLPSIFSEKHIKTDADKPLKSWQAFFRSKFIALFSQLNNGCIVFEDALETSTFGNCNDELRCHIKVHDPSAYTQFALAGSNGSASAYIQGLWDCNCPTTLIRILLRNRNQLDRMENGIAKIRQLISQISHSLNRNSKIGSKRNIAAHYDLGNEFFRQFLDQRMMYSAALYEDSVPLEDLQSASDRKLKRICDVLNLNSKDSVVEIGTGWGGFACYAAANTGCKVTTITISEEQYLEAKAKVEQQNLSHLVTVKLVDYRDLDGQFDKLVSIEMIEAVGHQYMDKYFSKINHLLKPDGQALLQAIVIDDNQYQRALKEVDFIKRFIFPGSFLPSYSLIKETASNNQLSIDEIYDMGSSYAQTLQDWRKRYYQQINVIDEMGYDDQFKRMWEFYLCYCEGGFLERAISVGQILFNKQINSHEC
ncbi:MAG: cyclopropane-fatty-acyl-phospholipid synthase family protein [Acidiferrobacterales bacterium]|nr:cyclopropane-fatty-acyl-phospholipid synthase family protein [Acidiferrobacterales bacterium]